MLSVILVSALILLVLVQAWVVVKLGRQVEQMRKDLQADNRDIRMIALEVGADTNCREDILRQIRALKYQYKVAFRHPWRGNAYTS